MRNNYKDISDNARANILKRLQNADNNISGLTPQRGRSADVFPQPLDLLATFADEFKKVNGQLVICDGINELSTHLQTLIRERNWKHIMCCEKDLISHLPNDLRLLDDSDFHSVEVGITTCEFLIARSGSILVSSAGLSGRLLNVFPPVHIVVASQEQLVPFLDDAITCFKKRYINAMPSQATVITGPSRTADIEKTLVMGAHGPKELILLLYK